MFFKFTACFTECFLFPCWFNPLVYSHAKRKLNKIEHTYNTLLGMISDVRLGKATFLLVNRTLCKVLLGMKNQ